MSDRNIFISAINAFFAGFYSDWIDRLPGLIYNIRRALTYGINQVLGTPGTEPLTGLDYITNQLREVFVMFACGASTAFLFMVYEGWMHRLIDGRKTTSDNPVRYRIIWNTGDFLFCIAAGLIVAQFWYISSFGRLSVHEAGGLAGGICAMWVMSGKNRYKLIKSKRMHTIAFLYVIMLMIAYLIIS